MQKSYDFGFNFFVSIYFLTPDYSQNDNDTLTFFFLGFSWVSNGIVGSPAFAAYDQGMLYLAIMSVLEQKIRLFGIITCIVCSICRL